MNQLSSVWHHARFRYGLRWTRHYPDPSVAYRFFFRVVMALAVIVMIVTHNDLKERAAVMEQVLEVYEPVVQVAKACEAGAVGYAYSDGRAFECSKPR